MKLTNDQIIELHKLATEKFSRGQRKGQAYVNALTDMARNSGDTNLYKICDQINGTSADPFYKDENLDRFFEEIC